MIPESFKNDLLNRVDVVDVINARVPLKKSGANFVACCPFHTEKTPSFTVSQPKQFYHCFGCGAHGNAIGFLMEYAGLGYVDAVKDLADLVGMKLPEFEPRRDSHEAPQGPDLYELMDVAARFYRDSLKQSPAAIEYLKGRGLTGKIAARFGVGYAPAGWQSLQAVFPDYAEKALVTCGLVVENEQGKRYDRFRDRIIFPILNQRGRVIGFGGRILDAAKSDEGSGSLDPAGEGKGSPGPTVGEGKGSSGPKYLNSPETPLFEKGRELYGLVQARNAIRVENRVVVVEGYMDVVALAQNGVENVIATLGTATTPVHVQRLLRLTDEIVFCFDGDAAGRRAAWHALEVSLPCLADGKTVRFLFLPEEHDPDSFVRALGRDAFLERLVEALPLSGFLLAELGARTDLTSLEGRSRLISEARPHLQRLAAPALQLQLVRALADLAHMDAQEVGRLCNVRVGGGAASGASRRPIARAADRVRSMRSHELERTVLSSLLLKPTLADEFPDDFEPDDSREAQAIVAVVAFIREHHGDVAAGALVDGFADAPFADLLKELRAGLLELRTSDEDADVLFAVALVRLQSRRLKRDIEALERRQMEQGLSMDERQRYNRLIQEHKGLEQEALRPASEPPSRVL